MTMRHMVTHPVLSFPTMDIRSVEISLQQPIHYQRKEREMRGKNVKEKKMNF